MGLHLLHSMMVKLYTPPAKCLEHIVGHEMAHLLEPTPNGRFIALLERFMPNWQFQRENLNCLPLRREHWRLEAANPPFA